MTGVRIRAIGAGIEYAIAVFTAGFAFGTVRVILLVPRFGATISVLLEAPVILAVSWVLSKAIARRFDVRSDPFDRALMGGAAFALLIGLELLVSVLVFGMPASAFLTQYGTAPALIGLAAQVAFALFPLVQVWRPR